MSNQNLPDFNEPTSAMDWISIEFLKSAWNSKIFIALVVFLFMGVTGGYAVYQKYLSFTQTYLYSVKLTFKGIDRNEYPNGSRFSLADFTDSRILQRVHEKNSLEKFGWSPEKIRESVNVTTTGIGQFAIIREFEILTKEWATTIAELEQVKEDFQRQLKAAPKNLIQFTFVDYDSSLPPSVAKKVTNDIASTWAKIFIKERGVVSYQIASIPTASIGLNKLIDQNSVEALEAVSKQLAAVQKFTTELEAITGSKSTTDPETGKNLVSIQQDLSVIRTALRKVPKNWSLDASQYQGRDLLPIEIYTSNIFDSALIKGKDYLVALDIVEDRIRLLQRDIDKLLQRPMGGRATDPVTGNTAYEIDQFLSDIIRVDLNILRGTIVELGISKDAEIIKLYYQTQIKSLLREKDSLKQRAAVVQSALDSGQAVLGAGIDNVQTQTNDDGQPTQVPAQITLPQVGEGFVDRLIELGERSGNDQFLRSLINRISELGLQEADLDKRVSRLEYYIQRIGSGAASNPSQQQHVTQFIKEIDIKLPQVMKRLQGHADSTNRIARRLAFASEIHSTLFPENSSPTETVADYVIDGTGNTADMSEIISELAVTNAAATRIVEVLNANDLNPDGEMYSATSDVRRLPVDLIDIRSVSLVFISAVAGFLFALMVIAAVSFRDSVSKRSRTAN